MKKIDNSIKLLYPINLIEGEGVGTSYEYHTKLRKLSKFINATGLPRSILIAGLPEKYGCSMDFFLLGQLLQAKTVVVDERSEALEKAQNVLSVLQSEKLLGDVNTHFVAVEKIEEFNRENLMDNKFDLVLSSEVLQRLNTDSRFTYISNVKKIAKNMAMFVPNRRNESHVNLSGLNSAYLEELLKYCLQGAVALELYDYGFIDMPPFPPGMCRSQDKREQANKSRMESFLMQGLELYSIGERIIPRIIKSRIAHIVYVMAQIR